LVFGQYTPDRIERERDEFFERVRSAFLARARAEPQRIRVVDATQSAAEVAADAVAILRLYIERGGFS
jgi:dTMP kinase